MTFLLSLIISAVAFAQVAVAADINLEWDGHKNATHYKVYMSLNNGQSWVQAGPDIPQPDPFPANKRITVTIENVYEEGLVLFRASSVRGEHEGIMFDKGAWYDFRLTPPNAKGLSAD